MNWTQGARRRLSRMSSSATAPASAATPASTATGATAATATVKTAATTAGTLKSATATTGATLETTTTAAALELLAACRAALGRSTGLRPIAGIEGRSLCGNVAAPGTTAKLRRAEIGALSKTLAAGALSARTSLQTLATATVLPYATLSGGARRHAGLSRTACAARELTSSCPACKLTSAPCPSGAATPLKAAVVPAGGGAGRLSPIALTGRPIAIGDTLTMRRIVLPGVAAARRAVDAVELIGVDVDAAAAPIGAAPAPERADNGNAGAKG
jgi:hypothetical protein